MTYLRHFDGDTYRPARDSKRLTVQWERVRDLMLDGRWRTLRQIADTLQIPEASASARLRDLRKPRFGAYKVERRNQTAGLHLYRIPVGELGEQPQTEPLPPPAEPEPALFTESRLAIFDEAA